MGFDFENLEDREEDLEESGIGFNLQDVDKREGYLEQEMVFSLEDEVLREDLEERELVFDICIGEERVGIFMDVVLFIFIFSFCRVIIRGQDFW